MPHIERTPEIRQALIAAHQGAQNAANDVGCAQSWVGPIDPEEDERNPFEMIAIALADAERNATQALAAIKQLRELIP
jgi:hypothetical protein